LAYGNHFPLQIQEVNAKTQEVLSRNTLKAKNHTIAFWIWFLVKADLAVNHRHNAIAKLRGDLAAKKHQGTAIQTFS
jgi:hypothetical protein